MALTRIYEEHEVSPEIRQIYSEIRAHFDLPYVPSIFKILAGCPEYLKLMWRDLRQVACSREFQAAAVALDEYIRSEVVEGGWKFSDQERALASQKVSAPDTAVLAGVVGIFMRTLPRLVLFTRAMQRGYSGGQQGRVSPAKHTPALSRLVTLHVPREEEASLRVWLVYSDIKRTTGSRHVISMFRVLSHFPGYLASVWLDAKKVFAHKEFARARDEVVRRSIGLMTGMPIRDHRQLSKSITPEQWRDIEETIDAFARLLPQFALLAAVWRRSFAIHPMSSRQSA
jgi:hypothetical protein